MSTAPVCTNLKLQDMFNNGDARDLLAHFYVPLTQTNVTEYRVFIVPTAEVEAFTLAVASAITNTTRYTKIVSLYANGSAQSVTYTATSVDYNGNVIVADSPYVAFILTVGKNGYTNDLTLPSEQITLTTNAPAPDSRFIKMFDINNYGNETDVRVQFNEPSLITNTSSYRLYIAPTSDLPSLSSDFLLGLSSPNFVSVAKSSAGSLRTVNLTTGVRDINGEAIVNGIPYSAVIQSVAISGVSSYSVSDRPLTMEMHAPAITISSRADVNNYNDARDIQVSFTGASIETNVLEYRVFVSTSGESGNFTQEIASTLSSDYYVVVPKAGYVNHTLTLTQALVTTTGEAITNGNYYAMFVLTVAQNGYVDTLSVASSALQLVNSPVSIALVVARASNLAIVPAVLSGISVASVVATAGNSAYSPSVITMDVEAFNQGLLIGLQISDKAFYGYNVGESIKPKDMERDASKTFWTIIR